MMVRTLPISTKKSTFSRPTVTFTVNFLLLLSVSLVQKMEQILSSESDVLPSSLSTKKAGSSGFFLVGHFLEIWPVFDTWSTCSLCICTHWDSEYCHIWNIPLHVFSEISYGFPISSPILLLRHYALLFLNSKKSECLLPRFPSHGISELLCQNPDLPLITTFSVLSLTVVHKQDDPWGLLVEMHQIHHGLIVSLVLPHTSSHFHPVFGSAYWI